MSLSSRAGNWTSSCTEALILSLYHTGQRRGGAGRIANPTPSGVRSESSHKGTRSCLGAGCGAAYALDVYLHSHDRVHLFCFEHQV